MRASASTRPSPESPIRQEYKTEGGRALRGKRKRKSGENGKRGQARRRITALPSGGRRVVPRLVRGADAAADQRLAADRARRLDADSGAHRQRQDPDRIPVGDQSGDVPTFGGP